MENERQTWTALARSCTLFGIEAHPVTIMARPSCGTAPLVIEGCGTSPSTEETSATVRIALAAAGYDVSQSVRVTLEFGKAPGRGQVPEQLQLAIAMAYLAATGQIEAKLLSGRVIVGRLTVSGCVVEDEPGLLVFAKYAQEEGLNLLSGPYGLATPGLDGRLSHETVDNLAQLEDGRLGKPKPYEGQNVCRVDISCIARWRPQAARVLTIAAAGGHNLLIYGPDTPSKIFMAICLAGLLPPLGEEAACQHAAIWSAAGLPLLEADAHRAAFRAPRHSASIASLVGGGPELRPGEASLAHGGVLFLDELEKFSDTALSALRPSVESGKIELCRADGQASLPARYQLVAAAAGCPCGYYGDPAQDCTCSEAAIVRYRGWLGGALRGCFDLVCETKPAGSTCEPAAGDAPRSPQVAEQVAAARERAAQRGKTDAASQTGHMEREVFESCQLAEPERSLVEKMAKARQLPVSGTIRLLRVARTIADLDGSDKVAEEYILEAAGLVLEGR